MMCPATSITMYWHKTAESILWVSNVGKRWVAKYAKQSDKIPHVVTFQWGRMRFSSLPCHWRNMVQWHIHVVLCEPLSCWTGTVTWKSIQPVSDFFCFSHFQVIKLNEHFKKCSFQTMILFIQGLKVTKPILIPVWKKNLNTITEPVWQCQVGQLVSKCSTWCFELTKYKNNMKQSH